MCNSNYFENLYNNHSGKTQAAIFTNIICGLGNGIRLNAKGFLDNAPNGSIITITEPVQPLPWIYPFSSKHFILEYAGCANPGFKEAINYLIECFKVTPDNVLREWKENIDVLEELRDAPTIIDPYTVLNQESEDYFRKQVSESTANTNHTIEASSSVYPIKFFDVQWSDCPKFVEEEVRQLWQDRRFGNDYYIYKTKLDEELFEYYPKIYLWLKYKGVLPGENVIIHWWW